MKYAIRTVIAVAATSLAIYSFSGKAEKPIEPETISQVQEIEKTYENHAGRSKGHGRRGD